MDASVHAPFFVFVGAGAGFSPSRLALDHDDFGLNQSKIMNVIDSKSLEWDVAGKPVPFF
jgi:hypothetical protein